MKKILYYNWTHIDGNNGGGVTIYQKNLAEKMLDDKEISITYLNSGLTYDCKKEVYLKEVDNNFNKSIKCYEIINSPVLAPVQQSIKNIEMYLNDKKLYELIKQFIIDQNGFDIIHFNNLEGLSISVLKLKEEFPGIKFIYSAHNYFPICSRVNLWKDEKLKKGHNCDKKSFDECSKCYRHLNYNVEIFSRKYSRIKGKNILAKIISKINPDKGDLSLYKEFKESNVKYFNKYIDCILAVSNRVKTIMVNSGFDEDKIKVSYIGTKAAESQMISCNTNIYSNDFNIMYMGYMREDKGFYFFLEALKKMDKELASKIIVNIVAKYDGIKNKRELDILNKLKYKFKNIKIVNGYNAQNQKELLEGINLGVVPVLWEDNLPQVALEQVSYGVPILVSDLGGVSEVCNNDKFIFKAGDYTDFLKKIENILSNREILDDFWKNRMKLLTMEEHIEFLKKLYMI